MVRFPVWYFAALSYRVVFANIDRLAGPAGAWLAISLLLDVMCEAWFETSASFAFLSFTVQLVVAPCLVACTWHRFILLGLAPSAAASVRIGRPELIYLLRALLLFAGGGAVVIVVTAVSYIVLDLPRLSRGLGELYRIAPPFLFDHVRVVFWIAAAIAYGVAFRMLLAFPAAAIGDEATTLAVSWARTRGQTLRIAIASFACCVPLIVAAEFAGTAAIAMLPADPSGAWLSWGPLLAPLIDEAGLLVQTAVFATFVSQLYRADKAVPDSEAPPP